MKNRRWMHWQVMSMNKEQLRTLVAVNLRYVNPQATDKERKKGKTGKSLTRSIINQYIFSGLLFIFIYGFMMVLIDFSKMKGFFTSYMTIFGLLAFSQAVSVIYNIFFESRDLGAYLPLPFSQNEIFLSKIMVVTITVAPFTFPLLVMFVLTGWRSGVFIVLAVILSILLFILFLAFVFGISSLLVFGLTKTKVFKKHKQLFTSLLLGLTMLFAVGGILIMNLSQSNIDSQIDRAPITVFLPFYYVMHQPFSVAGLVSLVVMVLVTGVVLWVIKATILPKLYEQLTDISSAGAGGTSRKYKANQTQTQIWRSYNLQLLKNTNLVLQILSTSVMMPIAMMIGAAAGSNGKLNLHDLPLKYLGLVFLAGVLLSAFTVNQTSFVGNMISLDQENFRMIQSLPISMKKYMQVKFNVAFGIQILLNILIALIGGLILHLNLFYLIGLIVGAIFGTYLLCLKYFARDYRFLQLDWTNISQLFSRGSGTLGLVMGMIGVVIVGVILLVLYGVALTFAPPLWINLPVFLIVLLVSFFWIKYYRDNFWKQFD